MLNPHNRYLQIALNSTLQDAQRIIHDLPADPRIIFEAGTPFIKHYGLDGISAIKAYAIQKQFMQKIKFQRQPINLFNLFNKTSLINKQQNKSPNITSTNQTPYIVADMKMMDRGTTEVNLAAQAGASAVVALGLAPIESLNAFIETCNTLHVDSMIDMMNVNQPYKILKKLKQLPRVVILHRGVDEEKFSNKPLPIHMINKIKGSFNVMISIAGGDTPREIQSAIFNSADIVVLWKNFFHYTPQIAQLANSFLKNIK